MTVARPPLPMTHPLRRIVAALFALWFTVLTVEPARLHSCPMHGGRMVSATGADQTVAHDSHAAHRGHSASGNTEAPEGVHACNCLGTCAVAGSPEAPVTHSFSFAESPAAASGLPELTRPLQPVAHAIPFANGPPRA